MQRFHEHLKAALTHNSLKNLGEPFHLGENTIRYTLRNNPFIMSVNKRSQMATITSLHVHPQLLRRGYGSAAIAALRAFAQEEQCSAIKALMVPPPARSFFVKHGFTMHGSTAIID